MNRLNVKQVQALIKESGPKRHADGDGLYLMIPKSGEPYWMQRFTWKTKRKEVSIGKVKDIALKEARLLSADMRRMLSEGINPIEERQRQQIKKIDTVDELFADWFEGVSQRIKHPEKPKRLYERDIQPALGSLEVDNVEPMEVRDILKRITASKRPTVANDALMQLKKLFNHAVKLGLVKHNPAAAFDIHDAGGAEISRTRILSQDELREVIAKFRQYPEKFTRDNYLAILLLLALGVRKNELIAAKWQEFDFDEAVWHLPSERTKTGAEIRIPLVPAVIEWLKELKIRALGSDYVFPNRRTAKRPHMGPDTLNRAIQVMFGQDKQRPTDNLMGDIEYFTVHDLRRTTRSLLAELGTPSHIAERCLNHKLKGVEGIYDRYDYFDERKNAISNLAILLVSLAA